MYGDKTTLNVTYADMGLHIYKKLRRETKYIPPLIPCSVKIALFNVEYQENVMRSKVSHRVIFYYNLHGK